VSAERSATTGSRGGGQREITTGKETNVFLSQTRQDGTAPELASQSSGHWNLIVTREAELGAEQLALAGPTQLGVQSGLMLIK
jgi:hypothetical protein